MEFFRNKAVAIIILIVIVILSSLYGLSKKPDDVGSETVIPPVSSHSAYQSQETVLDQNYELGDAYYHAGDFKSAIMALKQVRKDSPLFSDALNLLSQACMSYREEILGIADKYVAKQDYKTAVSMIDEALLTIPEDPELLEAQNQFKIVARSAAIEMSNQFLADGNYPGAIAALEEVTIYAGADTELNALYNRSVSDYKSALEIEAEQAYHTNGYESAVAILQQGLRIIGDDAELSELVIAYRNCVPYSFYSLTARTSEYYYDGDPQENYFLSDLMYDTEKTARNNVISCMSDDGNTTRLYTKSEFKQISGTLFFRLDSNDDTWHKTSIRIYGDGDLLYEKAVSNSDSSVYFEVDISNVIFLDVNIYTGFYSLSGNDIRFGGISDLNLFKNIM